LLFRCLYLAKCYTPVKKFAEALALVNHANIYLRETTSNLSLIASDPISASGSKPSFYPLSSKEVTELETDLNSYSFQLKRDWFAFNGGAVDKDGKDYKKPLFFNIALNYVDLDMDKLLVRSGKRVEVPKEPDVKPKQVPSLQVTSSGADKEKEKKTNVQRTKVEEVERPVTPEPQQQAPARGGLSSLLGGWWGRS
jgi:signal recognition particle subunit SRP68